MNALYKFLLLSLFVFVLLQACQPDNTLIASQGTPVLIGYLYGGQPVDSIRISLSNAYDGNDSTLQTLDDLDVHVSDGTDSHLLEPIGNGYYRLPSLIVKHGHTYELSFEYEGSQVSASTYVPFQREASISTNSIYFAQIGASGGGFGGGIGNTDPIEVSWDNPESEYYFVVVQNLEEEPEYINLLLLQLLEDNQDVPRFRVISEPEITDLHTIDTRRGLQQFGTHRVIIFRVNADYAALYESSGTSSVSITQPPSNVNNGLGLFTGVSGDTLFFEVEKQ